MEKASTYDLLVLSVSSKYDSYMRKKEDGEEVGHEESQEELLAMIKAVKDQENAKS